MDVDSLSHCKSGCKYHIVFAPKYRSNIREDKIRNRKDITKVVRIQENRNTRSGSTHRPHTYVNIVSTEIQYIASNGVYEGQKRFDDI